MQINWHIGLGLGFSFSVWVIAQFFALSDAISYTLAITALTGYWWISEAIAIPITSLLPLVLFPFFGVLDHKTAASALGNHVILLLMGAFMLAVAIEQSQVHKRLAFKIIEIIGGNSAQRIVMAIMVTAAILSMWISNTATVVALLPVVLAICSTTDNTRFKIALLLGLAYAASIGGLGTIIGTPPNVIFASVYEKFSGKEYGFLNWMKVAVPIVVVSIPLCALWLTRNIKLTSAIILPKMGAWQKAEWRVLVIFAFVAFLWIFRKEPFGGWSGVLNLADVGDSTIALLGVMLMAITSNGKGGRLLQWSAAKEIPWGMLLLFAGGICIASAFVASGLSNLIGEYLTALGKLPVLLMLLAITLCVSFLTEITSNTATATLLMPIIASAAIALNLPIELLMIPVVISCSCAFCLPVATAPNSIVFASGELTIAAMVKEGILLNVLLAVIVSLTCYLLLF
ncbi:SLC13 family permease [Pseudoalteromonas tunicata]|uniref:Na+/dicarboxylate symporter n=1 Tax=Pseudoalteromonas tunicata D2 TaxID=87626 RepID=A4C9R2_9GAMM|nr:SLC13 family permease [Pseudoalteromonas tunicata]ATC94666.1 solute carrier family 13 (sodium-dependent dicarboxylate transporter), member 2/3/5 [Pseudoalteromonas tunicata]AXT30385.1 SLC13/DASS family transporter [Pseudoalteromonas tunicata]EAR28120.1 Na+/dicarboxylate symporter [Pseudoalteromonas tunicata D2]